MLKSGQQNISEMNRIPMMSNQENAGNSGNSYASVFPALPTFKTSGTIDINSQCVVSEKRRKVIPSTVNEVIHYAILIVINKYQNL